MTGANPDTAWLKGCVALDSGGSIKTGADLAADSGPFLTGYLVAHLGTFVRAASAVALIYVVGMLVLLCARETKGQSLA